MNYKITDQTESSFTIIVNDNICFVVDASVPEAVTDRNGNIVGYTTLPEHAVLFQDFTTSQAKLETFCNMLEANPRTAFSQYLAIRDTL